MVNKQAQLDIILKTNPMRDDYHKGIRSVDDIHTYDEVVNNEGAYGWPDWDIEDGMEALHNGYITIYSSKPIKNGIFVTPAFSQANEYAGNSWWGDKITTIRKSNNMVYQKTVPLTDVAWIDASEGQYAKTGNKKVFLTEEQISFLKQQLNESRPVNLLTEGDSRLNKVYAIMDNKFNNINLDAPVSSSEYYLNGKGEKTSWRDYILYSLRHTFGLMSNSDVKYLPFVALIAFSDEVGFEKRNDNGTEINNLIQVILAIKNDNALFEKLKNTVSTYHQLMTIMTPYLENKKNEELNTINNNTYKNHKGYTLIEVNSFEVANEIGNYSSMQKNGGKLCYTQSEITWDNYTKNGVNKVYCFLKNGWKDIKPIPGENAPYDEYGLSMIFVFIDENGDMVYSNTRWNENAGNTNVDHSFTKSQLSEIVDMNINIVCKPHTHEELHEMGVIPFDEVPELLAQGKKPEEIFNTVCDFYNGFAKVELNGRYNYINTNGEILSPNQWFEYAYSFDNGFAKVILNDKYNFINTNCEILSPNQWFDSTNVFRDGFAVVEINGRYNFINTNGEILSPNQWFEYAYSFDNGFAKVILNDKYNFINTNCEILSPNQWFDSTNVFRDGFAKVELNGKWYYINTNGELFDYETKQPIVSLNENNNSSLSNVIQSFEPKKVLNPKIWEDGTLKKRARLKLLDIADDFIDTLNIKWVKPKDIILTGSIVNYNWSKYSDFDLHILIDFKKVDKRIDFVKEYFDSKKTIWNQQHDGLKIYGFPVELYVQDINEEHTASGIYSLYKDKWIKEPSEDIFTNIKLDKETIKNKTIKYMDIIDNLSKKVKNSKDSHKDEVLSKKIKKTFNEIKRIRKEALKNGNEMSIGNLMFKALRRLGYIEKLIDLRNLVYDKLHTLNENIDNLSNDTIYYHGGYFSELHDRDELTWFTSNKDYANGYGETIGAYKIKLNNPVNIGEIDIWLPENVQKRLHEIANAIGCDFEELYDILKNISSFEDEAVYSVTRSEEFMDILIAYGYDGVIATETGNPTIGVVSVSKSVKEINNINESKQVLNESMSNIIYHYTTLSKLYKILMDDRFMLASSFEKRSDNYSNKFYYLSTTRVKDSEQGYSRGYEVRITLDGDKLNQRYSGKAINYWGDSMGKNAYMNGTATDGAKYIPYRQGRTENEDRLFSNEPFIPNVRKYILRIDILENKRVKENKKTQIFLKNISNLPNVYVYEDEQAFRFQLNKGIINKDELDKRNIDYDGFSYWEVGNSRDFKSDIQKDGIEVSNIFQIVLFKAKGLKREERLRLINQYAKRYGLEEYIPTIIRHWGYGASIYDIEGYLRQLRGVMESNPKTYSILCKMLNDFYVENNLKNFNDLINYLEKR